MKIFPVFIYLSICSVPPVLATPICSEILAPENLERKHQYLAPIYNSSTTGWIFGNNQLKNIQALKEVEKTLLKKIVANLAQRGTQLAILMPPPRPVIAGQEIVNETLGRKGKYDVTKQLVAFQNLNKQIVDLGVVIPDLSKVALSDKKIRERYYFKRDTHWTNTGAAQSALALATALGLASSDSFDPAKLEVVKSYKESGSFKAILSQYCNIEIEAEAASLFGFSRYLEHSGLLSNENEAEANTILLGTSFSNRREKDQYQVSEAISAAIQRPVENQSIVGGGIAGAFEVYFLSDEFDLKYPNLLVWEFPYTSPVKASQLRQILGAIRYNRASEKKFATARLSDGVAQIGLPAGLPSTAPIGLRMTEGRARDITLDLTFYNGKKLNLRVKRSTRLDNIEGMDTWWVDVSDFSASLALLSLKVNGRSDLKEVELLTVLD